MYRSLVLLYAIRMILTPMFVYIKTETVQLFTLFVITIFDGLQLARIVYKQTGALSNEVSVEKMTRFCKGIILLPGPKSLFLPGPKSLILDRYYFHPRVCFCVCVCLSVCLCLPRLSQKVLDRFRCNLPGCFIMIKYRFLSKMSLIGPLERKLGTI